MEYENPNAVDETLERLGLSYIDLLFLHQPAGNYMAGYRMLEQAVREGKVRAIGISNFEGKYIDELLASCEITPPGHSGRSTPLFYPGRAAGDP